MSIVVNSRPSKTIEAQVCTWLVSGKPIVYNLTRKDQAFSLGANSGGFLRLQISSVDLTALFNVDDVVYVKSNDGTYSHTGTVTAVAFSGGHTLITTDITYIATPGAGYFNFLTTRPLYHLDVQLYKDTSTPVGPVLRYTPSSTGNIDVIVTALVEAQLNPVQDFTFTNELQFNDRITKPFYIKYREVWTGSAEAETNDDANKFNAVLGNMNLRESRIPHLYNYAECYGNATLIKWLKRSDEFKISRDFKTYLSFITYTDFEDFKVVVKKYQGNTLYSTTVLGPQSAPAFWDIQLDEEPNETVTSMTVQVTDDFVGTPVELSEVITFEYECSKNVIKLLWRNSLGGLEEHYFTYNQQSEYTYPSGRKANRLTMTAINVTKATWNALNELNNMADVYKENIVEVTPDTFRTDVKINQQVYLFDGTTSYGVIVIPTAQNRQTYDKRNNIEIQIEYPDTV